ncbi:histidine phosphatase family protein [Nigerium massiliense]|uniref:histidine phosphatase family protein n=1 Tax=Nigerium massiliense TaxID=1522317 RepID=UPI000694D1C8|nr:histidine phosphatase family protein [Nigerium massiliense]
MSDTRLILVRHGETDFNAQGRFQGSSDIPLNERGLAQAAAVAPWIARLGADHIVSSPLGRARQTAQAIAEPLELSVATDERLVEIHCGEWEGELFADIIAANPWYVEFEEAGRDFRRSDTGETQSEVGLRVGRALRELAERHAGQTTVVTAHGTAIRMGILDVLGLDLAPGRIFGDLLNCSWSILEPGEHRWRLVTYNAVVPGAAEAGTRELEDELTRSAAGTLDA